MDILGTKHPRALGGLLSDVWAEIWSEVSPLVDAALAGEATFRQDLPLLIHRNGYDEQTWFTFSYAPGDESGRVAGIYCACFETSEKVRAQARQAFLVQLSDSIGGQACPSLIMETVARRLLGEHLGVNQANYDQIERGEFIIEHQWRTGEGPSMVGRHMLADFGERAVAILASGEPIRLDDTREVEGSGAFGPVCWR